jgi:hypothetical protein
VLCQAPPGGGICSAACEKNWPLLWLTPPQNGSDGFLAEKCTHLFAENRVPEWCILDFLTRATGKPVAEPLTFLARLSCEVTQKQPANFHGFWPRVL